MNTIGRDTVSYDERDFIRGADGKPLRLFHGTCRDFSRFTVEVLRSTGAHFGCEEQANYFAARQLGGGRIFPVFLRSRQIADVGQNDFGWRYPNQTVCGLRFVGLLSNAEAIALVGAPRDSLIEAWHADLAIATNDTRCKSINRRIEGLLEARGIDCIRYSNRREPPDGKIRVAYLVLYPSQIVSAITGEVLG